jgi:hypothetical protein
MSPHLHFVSNPSSYNYYRANKDNSAAKFPQLEIASWICRCLVDRPPPRHQLVAGRVDAACSFSNLLSSQEDNYPRL